MRSKKSDHRTQLLLSARSEKGTPFVVHEVDEEVMQQMVAEGLFTHSTAMFNEGYRLTSAGMKAAERAWRQVPIKRFKTRYRNHRQVKIGLNGYKEEVCHVVRPNRKGSDLLVEESLLGGYLIDHPNGLKRMTFKTADEAIEWALEQFEKQGK